MSCGKHHGPISKRLNSSTTNNRFEAYSPWMLSIGIDTVKGVLKNKSVAGTDFESSLAIRSALVRPDNANAWTPIDAFLADAGERCTDNESVTGYTDGNFFVQFGVAYRLSAGGSGENSADVSLELSWDACGELAGRGERQLVALDTSNLYWPITKWMPAIHADKVAAAFIVSGAHANFRYRLAQQTATTRIQSPDAWSDTLQASPYSADGENHTGLITLSNATKMWVRFGLQFAMSAGTNGQAYVQAAVAVRRT